MGDLSILTSRRTSSASAGVMDLYAKTKKQSDAEKRATKKSYSKSNSKVAAVPTPYTGNSLGSGSFVQAKPKKVTKKSRPEKTRIIGGKVEPVYSITPIKPKMRVSSTPTRQAAARVAAPSPARFGTMNKIRTYQR